MVPSLSMASMIPVLSWGWNASNLVADPSSLPQCCGQSTNLEGCEDKGDGADSPGPDLQHWCRADSMKLPQSKPLAIKWDTLPSSPYECLSKCEINPQCYYVTYDSGCKWYGRGTETLTLKHVWFLMQTDLDNSVPQEFTTDGPYKKVDLGNQASYATCKAAWVQAFMDKKVDFNTGEYTKSNAFFTFADTKTGKGNVRVTATYNAPKPSLLDPSPAPPAPPVECDGRKLVWNEDDSVGLSKLDKNTVWLLSGSGMFPAGSSGKCLTTENQDSDLKKGDSKAKIVAMATEQSTCVSIGNLYKDDNKGDYPGKQWIVHINAWGDAARYGMGKCDDPSFLAMHHLKKNEDACNDGDCGSFTFTLVGDSIPDFNVQADAAAEGNCFGFVTTTTTTTTTKSTKPGGWCTSDSDLNMCQPCGDMEYPCRSADRPCLQPPKPNTPCADGIAYCQPWAATGCSHTLEANQTVASPVLEGDETVETNFEMCKAIFPGVDVPCVGDLKCCGENTMTPECYLEELNTCCKPPGSEISILCAKGESCSSINGVPICKPPGKACTCGKRLGLRGNETHYFCEPKDSEKCFHAPDDAACFHLYGDDADFCYIPPAYPPTLI